MWGPDSTVHTCGAQIAASSIPFLIYGDSLLPFLLDQLNDVKFVR